MRNVVIIGSGPAGLTACIYAARANLKPLCFEGFNAGGLIPGGQLMFTTDVENYPGFPEKVTGQELMQRFRDQAAHQGTEIVTADVAKVDLSRRPFKIWGGDDANPTLARTVIIATGARANYLGLPNEDKLKNKAVSACAVCEQRPLPRRTGGGDRQRRYGDGGSKLPLRALPQRDLDPPARRVPRPRQCKIGCSRTPRLRVLAATKCGRSRCGPRSSDRHRSRGYQDEDAAHAAGFGDVLAIGHTPCPTSSSGKSSFIRTGTSRQCPAPHRPAPGCSPQARDWTFRQAVTAAGTGCMAALEAERYLGASGGH